MVKRHYFTLLEVMVVIFIIGMVGSVLGYSMKGSMDEGRSYKSEFGSKQVYDLLMLQIASGSSIDDIVADPLSTLDRSGMATNSRKLLQDGWGNYYQVIRISKDSFVVYSNRWETFLEDRKHMTKDEMIDKYPWAFSVNI